MITEVHVGGFKSFGVKQSLPLAPLTVLIGANASGKSNLLEGLQLLGWLAQGRRLGDLAHAMRQGEVSLRAGRLVDLASIATEPVELGCTVQESLRLDLALRLDGDHPRLVAEALFDDEEPTKVPLYKVVHGAPEHGSELAVEYNNFSKGGKKPLITCVDQQAIFTQLLTPARFDAKHENAQAKIPKACLELKTQLAGLMMLDPNPKAMRGYSYLDDRELRSDGANVSAVLFDVCRTQGRADEVLAFVRQLPEQDIAEIRFLQGPRNDVMIQLVETFAGGEVARDAAVLSDGTLRVLAIAAAILSAPAGRLVVIEEIDNGVHPSRAQLLLDALHRVSLQREVSVLLTTHNPALLDAVPASALPAVVACFRDPQDGTSRLRRLQDLDDYPVFLAGGSLGRLATTGRLDRVLKKASDPSDDERRLNETLQLFRQSR